MKNYLFTLIVICSYQLLAQPTFNWAKAFVNSSGNGWGWGVAVDVSGNVYSVGQFQGVVDFDPGAGVSNMTAAGSFNDIYISKLDASGNFQWAKRMGSTDNDFGYGVALDASGNVYACGSFSGTVDFDPSPAVFNLVSPVGTDIFICKFDGNGNFLWARNMGGTSYDVAMDIKIDPNGNVLTTGYFDGTADFDPGVGTYTATTAGGIDIFISKLDAAGNFVWAKTIGSTSSDRGDGITVDASGNVYTTGYFSLTTDFDPGVGTYTLAAAGNTDIFVIKLDPSGNFVLAGNMGGTGTADAGTAIEVDASGNIYTTGYFSSSADFDPGPAVVTLNAAGNREIFVSKLNSSGAYVWAKKIGGTSIDEGYAIKVDAGGNVYTTGSFDGTVDFDPGSAVYNLATPSPGPFTHDIFLSKLDQNGDFVWAVDMGGSSTEIGYGLFLDPANTIYNTGTFQGVTDFDPGSSSFSITPPNGYAPYVVKLCQTPDKPLAIQGNTSICAYAQANFSIARCCKQLLIRGQFLLHGQVPQPQALSAQQ